jgi:hypothetical protein
MPKPPKNKSQSPRAKAPAEEKKLADKPDATKTAEAKPKRPVFVPPPKPGGNYPGAPGGGGKSGGPKPHGNMPKGRIFRHQGR